MELQTFPVWFCKISPYCAVQGSDQTPRFSSSRLVFIYMMLASVVLFENYSASYTSYLSVVSEEIFQFVKREQKIFFAPKYFIYHQMWRYFSNFLKIEIWGQTIWNNWPTGTNLIQDWSSDGNCLSEYVQGRNHKNLLWARIAPSRRYLLPQPIQRPATERLAEAPRWIWENNTETAIERMETEEYGYLNTLQSIYSQLGKARSRSLGLFLNDQFR